MVNHQMCLLLSSLMMMYQFSLQNKILQDSSKKLESYPLSYLIASMIEFERTAI